MNQRKDMEKLQGQADTLRKVLEEEGIIKDKWYWFKTYKSWY